MTDSTGDPAGTRESLGDDEFFWRLFRRNYHPLVLFFRRSGVSADQADDLIQETFLRAARGLAHFRGEASLETWLLMIAKHVLLNELRSRSAAKRRGTSVALDELIWPGETAPEGGSAQREAAGHDPWPTLRSEHPEPLEEVLAQERARMLREGLQELPARMRQCTMLRLQGLKYREIAQILDISIETVSSQIHQTRVKLRKRLGDQVADLELE